ncbi:MAG: hypothetical protein ACRD38_00425 [Nitrososphaerales archaeon]
MNINRKTGTTISAVAVGFIALLTFAATQFGSAQEEMEEEKHEVMDTVTVLLSHEGIPAGDFIHLYDSTPAKIMAGHVAAKLPCNDDGEPEVVIVAGVAPEVAPVEMEMVEGLSKPGTMCIYHADLPAEGVDTTDVAILNPTDNAIRLPRTSTVVISVSAITPGEPHSEHS